MYIKHTKLKILKDVIIILWQRINTININIVVDLLINQHWTFILIIDKRNILKNSEFNILYTDGFKIYIYKNYCTMIAQYHHMQHTV